jgi:hypothetical protein
MASGLFESVNGHEPKNAPGNGLTAALWADTVEPVRSSGLASVSARVTFNVRIYSSMLAEPQDGIDPNVLRAVSVLLTAYVGDFTLGDEARHVDIFGAYGAPLRAQAGYINQDGRMYRVMTISMPVVFNDCWTEAP